jgi:hypothetical protein
LGDGDDLPQNHIEIPNHGGHNANASVDGGNVNEMVLRLLFHLRINNCLKI